MKALVGTFLKGTFSRHCEIFANQFVSSSTTTHCNTLVCLVLLTAAPAHRIRMKIHSESLRTTQMYSHFSNQVVLITSVRPWAMLAWMCMYGMCMDLSKQAEPSINCHTSYVLSFIQSNCMFISYMIWYIYVKVGKQRYKCQGALGSIDKFLFVSLSLHMKGTFPGVMVLFIGSNKLAAGQWSAGALHRLLTVNVRRAVLSRSWAWWLNNNTGQWAVVGRRWRWPGQCRFKCQQSGIVSSGPSSSLLSRPA